MKPVLRLFSLAWLVLAVAAGPAHAAAAEQFQTLAPYAILMDADSGTVLYEKNADDLMSPASTSKIMVAEIVFEQLTDGRLKLDDLFTISTNAWKTGGAGSGGSTMFALVNSRIRVEDLIRGLVIDSGNDAAIALAEGISGSEDAFSNLMTKRARELGLAKSTFTNPWGRSDPDEKVTAREMARLTIHLIRTFPTYYKYFGEKDFTWNRVHQWNRNPLLAMNMGADGVKTGDTSESGYGMIGSVVQNGERLILVINGLKTAKDRANEAQKLLSWGFRSFDSKLLFQADETIGQASVYGGTSLEVPLVADGPVRIFVPRGSTEPLTGKIAYDGPLMAPVAKGTPAGHLHLYRGASEILELPLQTAADVPVGSLSKRALDAGLELVAGFFRDNVLRR